MRFFIHRISFLFLLIIGCNSGIVDYPAGQLSVFIEEPSDGAQVYAIDLVVSGSASSNVESVWIMFDGDSFGNADGTTNWTITLPAALLSFGTHEIQAWGSNESIGVTTYDSITITVIQSDDRVAPQISISQPLDGSSLARGTLVVHGTSSDNQVIARVEVSLDDTAGVTADGTTDWTHTFDTASTSLGSHSVMATVFDAAGNTDSVVIHVTLYDGGSGTGDTMPPNIAITVPVNNAHHSGSLEITGTASDETLLDRVEVSIDGGNYDVATGTTSWSYTLDTDVLSEDSHTISARAFDSSGNQASDTITFYADRTPPVAELQNVPALITNDTTISVTVAGAEVVAYSYNLDGTMWSAETSIFTPITEMGLVEGAHELEVVGVDGAGNTQEQTSATTHNWYIDLTPPDVTATGIPSGTTNSTDLTIDLGPADVVSFDYLLTHTSDGSTEAVGTGVDAGSSPDISISDLTVDGYSLVIIGYDQAGNADPTPIAVNWIVDTTPIDTILTGVPDSYTNVTSASIDVGPAEVATYDFTIVRSSDGATVDSGTGVDATGSPDITLAGLSDDTYTLTVTGYDSVGNGDTAPAVAVWTVDTMAPEGTIIGAPASVTNSGNVSIDIGPVDATSFNYEITRFSDGAVVDSGTNVPTAGSPDIFVTGLADNTYTLRVTVYDAAGNADATSANVTWTVDTVAPNTTLSNVPSSPTNSTSASIDVGPADVATFDYTVVRSSDGTTITSDTGASAAGSPDISLSGLSDDTYTVTVTGYDAAGNPDLTPASDVWIVDTTAPDTTISGLPTGTTSATSITVDVGPADVVTFDATLVRASDGATISSWNGTNASGTPDISVSGLGDDTYTLTVTGYDAAGNADGTPASGVWTVDATGPELTLSGLPDDPTNVTSASMNVGPSDVATIDYIIVRDSDGSTVKTVTGYDVSGSPDITVSGLTEDTYTITVTGYDAVGNADTTPEVYSWTVDTTAPDVTLSNTPATYTNATSLNIDIGPSDVASFDYVVVRSSDGTTVDSETGFTAIGSPDIYTSGLSDDEYTLTVVGYDEAGNADATPEVLTWTVDTVAPNGSLSNLPSDPTSVTTTAIDIGPSDVDSFDYVLTRASDGTTVSSATGADASSSPDIALSALADDTYTLSVTVYDAAGNADTTPATHNWTVDATPPNTVLSNLPDSPTTATSVSIEVGPSDVATFDFTVTRLSDGGVEASGIDVSTVSSPDISVSGLSDDTYTVTVTGYDATGNADPTPAVASWIVNQSGPTAISQPANFSVLLTSEDIVITFSETVLTSSLSTSGDLVGEISSAVWSSSDTVLTLSPSTSWTTGSSRTISLTVEDLGGLETTSLFVFDVIASGSTEVYVRASDGVDCSTSGCGSSATPYATISYAITQVSASTPAIVYVAQGSYSDDVSLVSDVSLYGGYASTDWSIRDAATYASTITGSGSLGAGTSIDDPYRTIDCSATATNATMFDGFVVTAPDSADYTASIGINVGCDMTVRNNELVGGTAMRWYGLRVSDASPEILYNVFTPGTHTTARGGAYLSGTLTATIYGNVVELPSASTGSNYGFITTGTSCAPIISSNDISITCSSTSATASAVYAGSSSPTIVQDNDIYVDSCPGSYIYGYSVEAYDNTFDIPTALGTVRVIRDAAIADSNIITADETGGFLHCYFYGMYRVDTVSNNEITLGGNASCTGTHIAYGTFESDTVTDNYIDLTTDGPAYGVNDAVSVAGNTINIVGSDTTFQGVASSQGTISNNVITAYEGIYNSSGYIDGNSITSYQAVYLDPNGVATTVSNNYLVYDNNGVEVLMDSTNDNVIIDNNEFHTSSSSVYAIDISGSTGEFRITDNYLASRIFIDKTCAGDCGETYILNNLVLSSLYFHQDCTVDSCTDTYIDANKIQGMDVRINGNVYIHNNWISNGIDLNSTDSGGQTAYIDNNTIYSGHGIELYRDATAHIRNNIFHGLGTTQYNYYGIYARNILLPPLSIRNNNFYNYSEYRIFTHGTFADTTYYTIVDMEDDANSDIGDNRGNTSIDPMLADTTGSDGDYRTMLDNDWQLTASSPCDVIQGAIDGSTEGFGYTNHIGSSPAVRTGVITCSPSLDSAGGWSIGAHEYD